MHLITIMPHQISRPETVGGTLMDAQNQASPVSLYILDLNFLLLKSSLLRFRENYLFLKVLQEL